MGFFLIICGCKILELKNPASVKDITNMRYGVDVRGDHLPPRWLGVDKFSDNPSVENAEARIFQTSECVFSIEVLLFYICQPNSWVT